MSLQTEREETGLVNTQRIPSFQDVRHILTWERYTFLYRKDLWYRDQIFEILKKNVTKIDEKEVDQIAGRTIRAEALSSEPFVEIYNKLISIVSP
jgi:hypothetical protein